MKTHSTEPDPVLIVDDEEEVLRSTEFVLRSGGFSAIRCESDPRRVMPFLEDNSAEMIMLDLSMPHIGGEELLAMLHEQHPEIPVVIVASADDMTTAVRCMRLGASDYIVKPFERSKLLGLVATFRTLNELRRENLTMRDRLTGSAMANPEAFADIVTQNEQMTGIFKYIESSAASSQPVLLSGETGVGKEVFARAVHRVSGRAGQFVAVNLAGLDEISFSDTLFGHRKGAFTGADAVRQGLIKQAEGGTLFLDEIGDLNIQSQIKLLRVLQEREFFPLGSDVAHNCDVRFVMASNVDLEAAERKGLFRKDLYFRIQTHHVTIPPLRERLSDIPILLDHFLEKSAKDLKKSVPRYPEELPILLQTYSFPGNVRELEAMVHEALAVHPGGTLSLERFRAKIKNVLPSVPEKSETESRTSLSTADLLRAGAQFPTLKAAETFLIREAMSRSRDNQGIAAAMLGISRQTLNAKLKALAGETD